MITEGGKEKKKKKALFAGGAPCSHDARPARPVLGGQITLGCTEEGDYKKNSRLQPAVKGRVWHGGVVTSTADGAGEAEMTVQPRCVQSKEGSASGVDRG